MDANTQETWLQDRLQFLWLHDNVTPEEMYRCIEVLAQVRQAQALESINKHLEFIARAVDNEVLLKEISIALQELVAATNG